MATNTQSFANLDTVYTAIGQAYIKQKIEDIQFDANPFLKWLQATGNVKKIHIPGTNIVLRVAVGTNGTMVWGSSRDVEVPQVQQTLTDATWLWSVYHGNVAFYDEEIHNCSGEAQMIDIVQAAIDQAVATMGEDFGTEICAGTGPAGNAFKINSLPFTVRDGTHTHPTADYGGLSATTYTRWKSTVNVSGGLGTLQKDMANTFNSASYGAAQPKMALTDQKGYELYEDSFVGNVEYNSLQIGDSSFKGLEFRGIPVLFDRHVANTNTVNTVTAANIGWTTGVQDITTSHRVYFLNPDDWFWIFDPTWNFDTPLSDWRVPTLDRSRVKLLTVRSQLVCKQPRQQGVLTSIPES